MSSKPRISDIVEASKGTLRVQHSMGSGDPYISQARLMLAVLHDGTEDRLLGDVQEIFASYREHLREYIHIERDIGTTELADDVREDIKGTLALHVLPPRGIVDVNRLRECALPMEFPPNCTDRITEQLLQLHSSTVTAMQLALDETKDGRGARTVLDLHSMSPWSPAGMAPKTQWNWLEKHVAYWANAVGGEPRPIDLIDATEDGEMIGDRKLSEQLKSAFEQSGYPVAFNKPYAKSRKRHPMFTEKRGVSVDFRKDDLADSPGERFNLVDCLPSKGKIARVAGILGEVLKKYLR